MKHVVHLSAIIVILTLSVGCATTGGRPSWISHPYDRSYPEKEYLCAVGSGDTRQQAIDAAFASLSRTFSSQVRTLSTYVDSHSAEGLSSDAPVFVDASRMTEQGSVSSFTEQVVGVEVVDTYRDEDGISFARVALDRKKTASFYRSELKSLEETVSTIQGQARSADSDLSRYFLLRSALPFAQRHQNLANQLQVLKKQSQKGILAPLEGQLLSLASDIVVSVGVDAPSVAAIPLATAFSSVLQDFGFQVSASAPVHLAVLYDVRPVEMKESPYRYVRYDLSANLVGPDIVAVSFHRAERIAAMDIDEAYRKALRAATDEDVTSFAALLEDSFGADR